MSKVNIMGIDIDSLTNQETIDRVEEFIINKKPLHLMGVNADKLNLCKTDKKLEEIVKKSEIINADGASVILAKRICRPLVILRKQVLNKTILSVEVKETSRLYLALLSRY